MGRCSYIDRWNKINMDAIPAREDTSPSPQPSVPTTAMPDAPPQPPANDETQSPETVQAQQEYIRALLRQSAPDQGQAGQEEDPTAKLLSSLLGGMPPGDQDAAGAGGGGGEGGAPRLSLADIAASLGVPPFITNMLREVRPQTEAEKREMRMWKMLHVVFSIAVAAYLLFLIGTSVSTYGIPPPPPATAQNPFVVFLTGELVLSGGRILMRSRDGGVAGLGLWVQVLRDVIRDGSIVLFLLGMGTWWHRGWQIY